jgi:cytoskeleton protein RodZ
MADEDAPLGTLGQELRGARISRGEDLATVSRALKIRKDHLEALEDDNISALPGRPYAIGFVRAYAAYLGLGPEETVERFKTEIAGRDEGSKNAGFAEPLEYEQGLSFGWVLFAIIIVGLIGYGAYALLSGGSNSNITTVAPVPPQMTEKQSAPSTTKSAHASATPNASAPQQNAISAVPSGDQIYGATAADSRVTLRATGLTHVLVQNESGTVLFNQILRPGEAYRVPNRPGLSLTAEHGNAVELMLDGNALGTAGQTADAAEALPLNPAGLAKRSSAPTTPE